MHKVLAVLLCAAICPSALLATGYDYRKILAEVSQNSDASSADKRLWRSYLDRASGVTVDEIREMFSDAADEFQVPRVLLEAIGYVENNWTQIGPSIDRGWGIMHLVENDYCDTLGDAAGLLKVDRQVLKDDPRQNIRGAAALLASYAGKTVIQPDTGETAPKASPEDLSRMVKAAMPTASLEGLADIGKIDVPASSPEDMSGAGGAAPLTASLEDWFPAASAFSGLISQELRDQQAYNYFSIISKGVRENTVFNQTVEVVPVNVDLGRLRPATLDSRSRSADYPEAKSVMTANNFNYGRNGVKIDTWVNHWMGVGTYAGAISWFQNPSAGASAHFCIRHDDGEITQVVRVADTAWHAGSNSGVNNNQRSIGIEHEATTTHPDWWNSEPMLNGSAMITRYFSDKYGIQLRHAFPGIVGHNEMPGCSTACPGNLPWDLMMSKILGVGRIAGVAAEWRRPG